MNKRASARINTENNRWGFIVFPIVFVLFAFGLAFFALRPVMAPALNMAQMFMAPVAPTVNLSRNLLLEAAARLSQLTPDGLAAIDTPQTIPESEITMPALGDQYGQLTVGGTAINAPVYWGDDVRQLNDGIGTYAGGNMPGFGGTIMLAGHTGSWLSDMANVEVGAVITVQTHYGTYTYEVTEMAVKDHQDSTAYDFSRQDENIIIYTCYPFRTLGLTPDRYFVYGKLLSGPVVDEAS